MVRWKHTRCVIIAVIATLAERSCVVKACGWSGDVRSSCCCSSSYCCCVLSLLRECSCFIVKLFVN